MVTNFAAWYNTPAAYQEALASFANYYRANADRLPVMLWRDSSPQHFDTPDGSYLGAVPPWKCQPIQGVTLDMDNQLHSHLASTQVSYLLQ